MQSRKEVRNFIFKLLINLIGINTSFLAAFYLNFSDAFFSRGVGTVGDYRTLLLIVNLLSLVIYLFPVRRSREEFRNYALFAIGYLGVIIFFQGYEFSRAFHSYFLLLLLFFTSALRFSNIIALLGKLLPTNNLGYKVILIGDEFNSSIIQYINSRPGNYQCVGLLSSNKECQSKANLLYQGDISCIESVLAKGVIDEVLISTSALSVEKINHIMRVAEKYHATTSVLPPYFEFLSQQSFQTNYWMDVPIISICHSNLSLRTYQVIKRLFDIFVSLIFLIFIFPFLCLIIIPAIRLSSRGPIFFSQLRKGYKQNPFHLYKFRTMEIDHGIDETVQAKRDDPRVTLIGKSLRKASFDEFPQFLNVLFGNMSIVGPRPHMVEHDKIYEQLITHYNVRFVTKPGITGWAQINGYRGATEDPQLMQKRLEYDLWYIRNWSFWLDLKIIALTAVKIIKDTNAY